MTDIRRTKPPPKVVLPRSPREFDQSYFNNFVARLQQHIDVAEKPAQLRGGELFLDNLPTTGAGLPAGYVFSDGGILKIVRTTDIFASSFSLTLSVGSVVVSS